MLKFGASKSRVKGSPGSATVSAPENRPKLACDILNEAASPK